VPALKVKERRRFLQDLAREEVPARHEPLVSPDKSMTHRVSEA
jgi:hypothetical protein